MKKERTITQRFLRYLIFVIIASNFLIALFCYGLMKKHAMEQATDLRQNLMESNLTMISQYFDDIDSIADAVIYNRDVIEFMRESETTQSDLALLRGIESRYYSSHPELEISFYKAGQWTGKYSIEENQSIPISDYRYTDWYQQIIWTDATRVRVTNEESENPMQSYVYKIEDLYTPYVVGYFKIDIDMNYLKERFLQNSNQITGTTFFDRDGTVLFYDNVKLDVPLEILERNQQGTYENEEYIISYAPSESTGWYLCLASSKSEIVRAQNRIIPLLLFTILTILGLTIYFSRRLSAVITVNFNRLVEGMEQVKKGNLEVQVEAGVQDEIGILIGEFNEMMRRIEELVKRVEAEQLLVKEAEIKALQQQINPHFIYNSLETIMGLACEGMDQEILTVSRCLSEMLRYNTRFENVTLMEKELEQIKNYVAVIKIRFEDRFEVYYDIDDNCLKCQILKFTLQPMLENAISHGLSETETGGMLRVRVKKEDNLVSIMVYDNGIGIDEDKLKELNERMKVTGEKPLQYIEKYKSLGILNVHLRSKLFYGEGYSIEIFSKKGRGTCIAMKIPYVEVNS